MSTGSASKLSHRNIIMSKQHTYDKVYEDNKRKVN